MTKERIIFFDYAGLLFDCNLNQDTLDRAHQLVRDYLETRGHKITLATLRGASSGVFKNGYLRERARPGNREWPLERIVRGIFSELGIPLTSGDLRKVSELYKLNNHDSQPRGGVIETIPRLADRYGLGIISNSTHNSLIDELTGYDLLHFFDPIVFSFEVGARKPNPLIYQVALRKASASASDCLFVSHDEEEVSGAEKVGMHAYLITPENRRSVRGLLKLRW
jgi:HAD superfamily hydrolase (TIGR01509 family)